jgi:hypothetical protein
MTEPSTLPFDQEGRSVVALCQHPQRCDKLSPCRCRQPPFRTVECHSRHFALQQDRGDCTAPRLPSGTTGISWSV